VAAADTPSDTLADVRAEVCAVTLGTGCDALAHAPSPPTGTESPQRSHVVVAAWFMAKHSGHGHAGTFIVHPTPSPGA